VGVVFQNYALFPHMTVGENVGYGLNFADPPEGMSRSERVAELLELVDLPDAADRDPESLSGGQQQRVAMARALAPGPDLLLLDEPMSALDAQLRERLRVQVRRIQSELGITTVYVTHDQEEALAISDRVAVMRDGTPEQIAPRGRCTGSRRAGSSRSSSATTTCSWGGWSMSGGETWTTALPEPPASTWAVRSSGSRWMT